MDKTALKTFNAIIRITNILIVIFIIYFMFNVKDVRLDQKIILFTFVNINYIIVL